MQHQHTMPACHALRALCAAALAFLLAGCVASPDVPSGCIAYQPAIPLYASLGRVCAVQLTSEWAVSVKHGADVLGESLATAGKIEDPDYDLVFFPRKAEAPVWRDAEEGEAVITEGNPRIAGGLVDYFLPLPVPTRERAEGFVMGTTRYCGAKDAPSGCTDAILFKVTGEAKVRHGYSGGPLIGTKDGAIIGMVVAGREEKIVPRMPRTPSSGDVNFATPPDPPPDPLAAIAFALPTALIRHRFHWMVDPSVW